MVYNINGFFDKLVALIRDDTENGFIRPQTESLFVCTDDEDEVVRLAETGESDLDEIKFYD